MTSIHRTPLLLEADFRRRNDQRRSIIGGPDEEIKYALTRIRQGEDPYHVGHSMSGPARTHLMTTTNDPRLRANLEAVDNYQTFARHHNEHERLDREGRRASDEAVEAHLRFHHALNQLHRNAAEAGRASYEFAHRLPGESGVAHRARLLRDYSYGDDRDPVTTDSMGRELHNTYILNRQDRHWGLDNGTRAIQHWYGKTHHVTHAANPSGVTRRFVVTQKYDGPVID